MIDCKKAFKRIDALEKQYITLLEEFCLIESPTDYKEGVDAAGNYIVEKAKAFGWKIEKQEQKISGDCICITMNPDATEKPVCLSGHVDTVHPVGMFGTPAARRDGEKIYGPGATDCKGGVVAAFMAMDVLRECGFESRPVRLLMQTDEETGSSGSNGKTIEYICEKSKKASWIYNQ